MAKYDGIMFGEEDKRLTEMRIKEKRRRRIEEKREEEVI